MNLEKPKNQNKEYLERIDRIEKNLNSKKAIQESFEEAKSFLEYSLGIKLTQIELVGLHLIAVKVMNEVYQQEKTRAEEKLAGKKVISWSVMSPQKEILSRFMQEFYDMNPRDIVKFHDENNREIFQEYFRRMQAKAHLP